MSDITFNINGYDYTMKKGLTILEASFETMKFKREYLNQPIPVLYYLKGIVDVDKSGVCVAEANGEIVNASETYIEEGMKILTRSEKVNEARKAALAEILKKHNKDCLHCFRDANCELQNLLHEYGFTNESTLPESEMEPIDTSSAVLVRDNNKCIRCKRCINACAKTQAVSAIACTGDGLDAVIAPASPNGLAAASCVNCGQCVAVCPVGALTEKPQIDMVKEALADEKKYVVAQVAPAVRTALGENFGFNIGNNVAGRIAGALKDLGFNKVFDTKFSADLTIMEESTELLDRIQNDGVLPLITSCCPGWIKYAEHFYPDMLPNISSCKAPHTMFGAMIKSYFAEKEGLNKEDIVVVSIMPCTAKKFEITRDDECGAGVPDVDYVLTTNELSKLIKDADLPFEFYSQDEKYDIPFGEGSGAGVIFGTTGGVMEAALRTAVHTLTGKSAEKLEFTDVRGLTGIKEASYNVAGKDIKVAIASGLANANALLTRIKNGEADYQFVEIMACPGGCVNGGGQPHQNARTRFLENVPKKRADGLYNIDCESEIRESHEDPAVKEVYKEFLITPGSEKAHKLLHTTYVMR